MRGGQTIEDFPLEKISSIQWAAGMVQGTLTIFASGTKADIDHVDKKDGKQIADTVRARLAGQVRRPEPPMAASPRPVPPAPPPQPDVYEQLRKLGELRDLGVVTTAEFDAKKRELLSRI